MDNRWNSYISRILGSFWCRLYSGYSFIRYIKEELHILLSRLNSVGSACVNSLSISIKTNSNVDTSLCLIPIEECLINRKDVTQYKMSGIVHKQSDVRLLSVPTSYIKSAEVVQDSPVNPGQVWINGVNMYSDGDYTTLIVPLAYSFNVSTKSNEGVLKPVYVLYMSKYTKGHNYNSNFGCLYGADLDTVDDQVRNELWKAHILGVTHKTVNMVLSASISNATADSSFTVTDIWSEMGTFCILGSNGRVYTGKGIPAVTVGDTVNDGDFLFRGVTVFNSKKLPSAIDMPFLEIKTVQGPAVAYNDVSSPITINGVLLPEYNNQEWANAASAYCADKSTTLVSSNEPINHLHHAIKTISPGSSCYYSIKGDIEGETYKLTSNMISDISINADFRLFTSVISPQIKPKVSYDTHVTASCSCEQTTPSVSSDIPKCMYI